MNSIKYPFIVLMLTFLFMGCDSSERKCKDVFCNYGYCQDGTCICQNEYTGSDCSQLKPPAYLTVTKVEVLRHPEFTTGGFAWDESNGRPDIYPTLSKSNVLLWTGAQKLLRWARGL